ncbi:dnaJ homolog subfamily C member 1 [Esox lucius]|uniref:DnaJ homolog subfamily C member 1 n=1 Tax=Esox lucius TaxID=8010 RepID=A0A6Q2X0Y5_ESOLU|nr:dnaJ homolog subfamily C member 1 [Esox lucius]
MTAASWNISFILAVSIVIACFRPAYAWDSDLELYDLVEEIQQNFYEFLSVEQDASSADIRKAYRRLSLTLHPDKNKDENAETQFRQLVAIYEVLKDEQRRERYNDVLVNGLPDWRQPVFYYRRVRKMSNGELGFLLFLILTVCHYAVIWSIYLEKQLDELLSKKKKEKKKKMSSKSAEESRPVGLDKIERSVEKPHWQDILPLKLSIWLYLSIKSLPHVIQDAKQYYEDYKVMKVREREEAEALALAEQEATTIKEKRPKVKKPKFEFPVYEPSLMAADSAYLPSYDQGTSIEEIEDQMDDWLEDKKSQKKKAPEWSDEDITLLTRSMAKFPGGTPGRWEKIAHELGRTVSDVTAKVKQVKDSQTNTSGLVKLSELKAQGSGALPGKASKTGAGSLPDSLMTQRDDPRPQPPAPAVGVEPCSGGDEEEGIQSGVRRRGKKAGAGAEDKVKGRRQRDFDPTAAVEDDSEEERGSSAAFVPQPLREKATTVAEDVWTQNQQKLLEQALQQYPRGTTERWDRIAKMVPGKSKEECMIRYKLLAELVLKRKQAKS